MSLGLIMTKNVVTVSMDERLEAIRQIFAEKRFHHLLVLEDKRLVGVVSDRDLLKSISPFVATMSERPQDRWTLNKRVHQIMTRKLITAKADMEIAAAAKLLVEHGVSCLPVVSDDGAEVVGIVTWKDILKCLV